MRETGSPQLLGRHNPRVARLRRIIARQEPELTAVDGLKLTLDLAAAGVPIVELFTVAEQLEALRASPALEQGRPRRPRAPARRRDRGADRADPPDPGRPGRGGGSRAPVSRPPASSSTSTASRTPATSARVIRCAAAFGASGVACSPGCADPFSPRAVRASAGQSLVFPVQAEAAFAPLADGVRRAGGEVVATASRAGVPLPRWRPRAPLLLALGNEGQGVSPEVAVGVLGPSVGSACTMASSRSTSPPPPRSSWPRWRGLRGHLYLNRSIRKGGRGDPTS